MTDNNTKDWKKFKEETDRILSEQETEIEGEEDIDGQADALEHPSYPDLEEKLTLKEQEAHAIKQQLLRAMADFENYKRQAQKDLEKAHRFGNDKIVASLLPVIDCLEQALQSADKEVNSAMVEGLELTLKLFTDVLQKNSVEVINPEGAAFNPAEHEAISTQSQEGAAPNSVLTVVQKGYKLNGRVVRPALVIVAKD